MRGLLDAMADAIEGCEVAENGDLVCSDPPVEIRTHPDGAVSSVTTTGEGYIHKNLTPGVPTRDDIWRRS